MNSNIKILYDLNVATPRICFRRPGGARGKARLYLERVDGVWTPEQRNVLKQVYAKRPTLESGDGEWWTYYPNSQVDGANEMNDLVYRCVLEVFSHGSAHNERKDAQYFKLPEPGVYEWFWLKNENETIEDKLDSLPATLQIEPRCWRRFFGGDSQRCAPLILETTARFRPQILMSYENKETEQYIQNLFQDDSNGENCVSALTKTVDELIYRVNKSNLELYEKKARATTTDKFWKYTFPTELFTPSYLNLDDGNLELLKRLQYKRVKNERIVIPLRAVLYQGNNFIDNPQWSFNLEVMPQTKLSGGIALDCGSSSCCAAFIDAYRFYKTATSEEQAERRCEELGNWLLDSNAPYRSVLNELILDVLDSLEPNSPHQGNYEFDRLRLRLLDPNSQYLAIGGIFKFTKEFERQLRLQSKNYGVLTDEIFLNEDRRTRRDACLAFIEKWYEIESKTYETFSETTRNIRLMKLDRETSNDSKTSSNEFLYKEDAYLSPNGYLGSVDLQTKTTAAKNEYLRRFGYFASANNESEQANVVEDGSNQTNIEKVEFFRNPKSLIYRIHHDKQCARIYQGFINSTLQKAAREYYGVYGSVDKTPCVKLLYPADLSPMGRRKLRELTMQLGYPVVDVTCDESVASAVFYLAKALGDSSELGPEFFKTRCVRVGNKWYHNMLIVDVGSYTTDVSLVQFELKENYPTNPTIQGGREYCITPRLLATQGNPHLAGNYLTLTLFHYLRALVALRFYPAPDGQRNNVQTLNLSPNLTARVLSPESTRIKTYASEKLPTNYMAKGITEAEFEKRYRRFNAIWNMAEKIKIQMSEKQKSNDGVVEDLRLDEVWTRLFFDEIGVHIPQPQQEPLQTNLVLSGVVFDALQNALVQDEIINRMVCELTQEALIVRQKNRPDLASAYEGVDSVILSGCSSRLPNLEKLLKKTIQESATRGNGAPVPFATSRTRLFFENKYAKSATVLGAAYVWNNIRRTIVNVDANPIVDLGFCTSRIDVRSMVYYLPASYVDARDHIIYFKLQTKYVKNGLGVGEHFSIMSDNWIGGDRHICISKQMGNIINPPDYAEFDFRGFLNSANAANQGDAQRANNVAIQDSLLRARFEIDLEQDIYVLVSRLAQPDDQQPKLFYTTKIKGIRDDASYTRYNFQKNLPVNWMTTAQDGAPKLAGNIEIVGDGQGVLFAKDAPLDQRCLKLDGKQALCRWSQRSFKPFATQAHTTTLRFSKNAPNAQDEFVTFNLDNYYQDMIRQGVADEELRELELKVMTTVELDEVGKPDLETASAHIFVGNEPAYAETEDVAEWVRNPGLVYRKKITNETPYLSDEYNPFSGNH